MYVAAQRAVPLRFGKTCRSSSLFRDLTSSEQIVKSLKRGLDLHTIVTDCFARNDFLNKKRAWRRHARNHHEGGNLLCHAGLIALNA